MVVSEPIGVGSNDPGPQRRGGWRPVMDAEAAAEWAFSTQNIGRYVRSHVHLMHTLLAGDGLSDPHWPFHPDALFIALVVESIGGDKAELVRSHAKGRNRPDYGQDLPKVATEREVETLREVTKDDGSTTTERAWVTIQVGGPDQIRIAQRNYEQWWLGLKALSDGLVRYGVAKMDVQPPLTLAKPWTVKDRRKPERARLLTPKKRMAFAKAVKGGASAKVLHRRYGITQRQAQRMVSRSRSK